MLRLLPLFLLLLLSSCAATRNKSFTAQVSDTTHVIVTDTTHIVLTHDSTHVTDREVIHEHIVTLYDPSTGNPTTQTTDRDIIRRRDSIVSHLRDSIYHALTLDFIRAYADSLSQQQDSSLGEAALSPAQTLAQRLANIMALAFAIILIIVAVRSFRSN